MNMNSPVQFYKGVKVRHANGDIGTILEPGTPLKSTTMVTIKTEDGNILTKVPIEKLDVILPSRKIIIYFDDEYEPAEAIRRVAELVEYGYTQGGSPNWEIVDDEE